MRSKTEFLSTREKILPTREKDSAIGKRTALFFPETVFSPCKTKEKADCAEFINAKIKPHWHLKMLCEKA
ncbi:hypothetical protein K0B03_04240 [Patescibacteria group bacterium]|nr:hypothetical protein [Patescibacteria group bacterium]